MIKIKGKITAGKKEIGKLNFPSLAIKIPRRIKKKDWGIYFSLVKLENRILAGLTHLGPFFFIRLKAPICQTFIIGRRKKFIGKSAELFLLFKLKEVERHPTFKKFKKQIKKDTKVAKRYFGL